MMRCVFGWSCIIVFAVVFVAGRAPAAATGVDAVYREKSDLLDEKDVDGHYRLAEWCRQQGRYDLAAREARKVLAVDPNHDRAAVLLRTAERKLREDRTRAPATRPAAPAPSRLLSDADVQKLRWAELQATQEGPVEPVRVEFAKGFAEEFLRGLAKDTDRERFRRAQPAERFQMVIDAAKGVANAQAKYADQIKIVDDPRVFSEFKRAVLPEVMRGCATPACHGGATTGSFRLVNERGQPTQSLYTNFYILQSATGKGGPALIDRKDPDRSLLLQYLLPANEAQVSHPPAQVPIKPMVRSRRDRMYRTLLDWIWSLRHPQPDYGIQYEGAEPSATSQPAAVKAGTATRPRPAPGRGGQ